MKYLLCFFLFTISFQSISQTKKPNNLLTLENQLFKLYNQELYDSAYKKIDQVIKDVNSTNLELCFTHIYLSQLNKRLFSYKKTFEELQIALEYAEKCKDVDFAKTNVLAEMALYYYDKDLIKESEELVLKLLPSAQQYLDETTHAYLLLIVGSIQFIDNNETESALNFFNKAEAILRKFNPCHLPLVYTKKLRLYTNTERAAEYELLKKLIEKNVDSCNIFKYHILLASELQKSSLTLKKYEDYIKYDILLDSLHTIYMAQNKAIELEESISKYKIELNIIKERNSQEREKFLGIIVIICLFFIVSLTILLVKLYRSNRK